MQIREKAFLKERPIKIIVLYDLYSLEIASFLAMTVNLYFLIK